MDDSEDVERSKDNDVSLHGLSKNFGGLSLLGVEHFDGLLASFISPASDSSGDSWELWTDLSSIV